MSQRKSRICQLLEGTADADRVTLSVQLARHFQSDCRFTFICLGDPGSHVAALQSADLPVLVISRRPGLDWSCSLELMRALHYEKIELIHAHQTGAFVHGLIARLYYRKPSILITMHDREHLDSFSPRWVVVNRILLESRDQIVAASLSVRQALIMNEGLPPQQVGVIYNGLVPPPEAGAARDGPSARQEIGVGADAFLILQFARFDLRQNHRLAITAMEQVVPSLPHARLALVGEGPDQWLIREMIRQRGLESHVFFLGPRADHARLLAAADLVLHTGSDEGIPPVLIQALAAGRPVVAMRGGGAAEVVEDRTCGLLARAGDYATLAENIRRLGASPELREQFGSRGRQRVDAMFSRASTTHSYFEMYYSMLAR